jgi:hypothetical protein
MSIRDFHAKLVSHNDKTSLFGALRRLSAIADPKSLFAIEMEPWPEWVAVSPPALAEPA